jgi:ADP-ribose pyrophosphatase YjhB (NUDIX family)
MLSTDDLIEERELRALARRHGEFPRYEHTLLVGAQLQAEFATKRLRKRRGEVVFVLQRGDGRILTHTKRDYPPGLYRLPTGGLGWKEGVETALRREIHEETGFVVETARLLGLLTYSLEGSGHRVPFASFVYLVTEVEGTPVPVDASEGITGFRWVQQCELAGMAEALRGLAATQPRARHDWGRFRALAHDFVHGCHIAR